MTFASGPRDLGLSNGQIARTRLGRTEAMGGHCTRGPDERTLWKNIVAQGVRERAVNENCPTQRAKCLTSLDTNHQVIDTKRRGLVAEW